VKKLAAFIGTLALALSVGVPAIAAPVPASVAQRSHVRHHHHRAHHHSHHARARAASRWGGNSFGRTAGGRVAAFWIALEVRPSKTLRHRPAAMLGYVFSRAWSESLGSEA